MKPSLVHALRFVFVLLAILICVAEGKRKHKHRGRHHHRDPCPNGWSAYDDSCYLLVSRPLSWAEARESCARLDAHLVTVNNDAEADWINVQLAQVLAHHRGVCPVWWTAGANKEGSWVWHQDHSVFEMLIQTTKWFGGRPNAYALTNYTVTMQISQGYFGLVAREADTRLPSVCEKETDADDSTDSTDSDRSHHRHGHGHHGRGHSRGHGSRGRHSRGRDSRGSHSHSHSRGRESHESHERHGHRGGHHHGPGRRHDDRASRYGHSNPHYRRNPYSPYYPTPVLPHTCPQPLTTLPPTTTSATTPYVPTTQQTTEYQTTDNPTTEPPTTPTTEQPEPCPPGWFSFHDSCYQIHDTCAQTRHTAQAACKLLGGHLVSIDSLAEESFLTSRLDRSKDWWISGQNEDGQWSWGSGESSSSSDSDSSSESSGDDDYFLVLSRSTANPHYTNWHQNQPTSDDDTFAVLDWSKGLWGWKSHPGHDYKYYICEVNKDDAPSGCQTASCQLSVEGIREQDTWERFLSNEYLVQDRCAKTRSDAAATCRQQRAQLLSIRSSAEMRYVQRLLRARAYDMEDAPNWWTNGMKVRGRWQWQGSRRSLIYSNWGPNIDFPRGNFLILHYYPVFDKWMWTDTKPSQKLPFICKRSV